ncbi:hypothetical protein PYCH_17810 [Pyrococcus yayanosii CH1]|uniref:Uncharacterized protein n=2 Tax=Pyrococcus TaxID=2260 RepID=F8AHY3_PYRYC|nr:hypothetical protein PYCH_17810 [Pyrococcus yayanosii CH1]
MRDTLRLISRLIELTRKGYIEDYEREEVSKILRELKAGGFTSEEIVFLMNRAFSASWVRSLTAGTRKESEKHKEAVLKLLVWFIITSEKAGGIGNVVRLLHYLGNHEICAVNVISLLEEVEDGGIDINDLIEVLRLANSVGSLYVLKQVLETMKEGDEIILTDLLPLLKVAQEYGVDEVVSLIKARKNVEEEVEMLRYEVEMLKKRRDALKEEVDELKRKKEWIAKEYSALTQKYREFSNVVSIVKELVFNRNISTKTLYHLAKILETVGPEEVADIALDVKRVRELRIEVRELEERKKRLVKQVETLEAAKEKVQDELIKIGREFAKIWIEIGRDYGELVDDMFKKAKEYTFTLGLLEALHTLLYSQDVETLRSVPIYVDFMLLEAIERHVKALGENPSITTLSFEISGKHENFKGTVRLLTLLRLVRQALVKINR